MRREKTITCLNCSTDFRYRPKDRHHARKYCSSKCATEWQSKNLSKPRINIGVVNCPKCKASVNPSECIFKPGRKNPMMCKPCFYTYQMRRWNSRKVKAINLLGGKCQNCGLSVHPALFDFDHRDPTTKEYSWNELRSMAWSKILEELAKCDLLCCSCHRLRHTRPELWEGLSPVGIEPTT